MITSQEDNKNDISQNQNAFIIYFMFLFLIFFRRKNWKSSLTNENRESEAKK